MSATAQTKLQMPANLKAIMPEWHALRAKLHATPCALTEAEGRRLDDLNAFIRVQCSVAAKAA